MKIIKDGGRVTMLDSGRIDTYSAPGFTEAMKEALDGAEDLTLDLNGLEYISSSGLRVVMLAVKTMVRQGNMRIVNVCPEIYDIFETTGFTAMCDIEMKSE